MKTYIVMAKMREGDKAPPDFAHIADVTERRNAWKAENELHRSRLFPILESMNISWARLTDLIPAVMIAATGEQAAELRKRDDITIDENRSVSMIR